MDRRPARHLDSARIHDEAAERHEHAAAYWAGRNDAELAELERRNAAIERDAAELERDRARVLEERERAKGDSRVSVPEEAESGVVPDA
jgi:hypothetical protein